MTVRFMSQVLVRPAAGAFLALLLVLAFAGCGDYELDSLWLGDSAITVDGDISDWRGSLYYLEKEKASVGIQNDAEHLYICLITQDPTLSRQAVSRGLIIWFDPTGGKDKVFGINYPSGAGSGMRPQPGQRGQTPDPEQLGENLEAAAAASLEKLRFLDADGLELNEIKLENLTGEFAIAAESRGGMFIYELKVPLQQPSDLPSVLGAQPGRILGIGLEIPKMEMPSRGSRPAGGMGGRPGGGRTGGMTGGMGGGARGGGGRGGGMRGGGSRGNMSSNRSQGMKLWSKVLLATG
jgi:hypothetical protein